MKLELKHLAPYLPYKLLVKSYDIDNGTFIQELESLNIDDAHLTFTEWDFANDKSKKLILRPMSDMRKEIEIDGVKFSPMTKLKLLVDGVVSSDSNVHYWDLSINYNVKDENFDNIYGLYNKEWEKLFMWHFDVFGLIPKGLAVDINTLNN